MKIVAEILHYNSPESLLQLIDAILNQSIKPSNIVIVDNGSSIKVKDRIKPYLMNCDVIWSSNNGVGAGHNTGWIYIMQKFDPDFIWVLEHDVLPDQNCLEILLNEAKIEDLGVYYPAEKDNLKYNKYKIYECNLNGIKRLVDKTQLPNYFGGLSFNACLIPAKVIKEVGYLNEAYFVGREDIDYYKRIYAKGGYVLRVNSIFVKHDLHKNKRILTLGNFQFLFPNDSPVREYYSYRNGVYDMLCSGRSKKMIQMRHILGLLFILFFKSNKYRRLINRNLAIRHAFLGILGKCEKIHL